MLDARSTLIACRHGHRRRHPGRVARRRPERRPRAARNRAALQGLAPGGGPAHALQQPRPRGGRGPDAAGRLRRLRPRRPQPRGAARRSWPRCSSSRPTRRCSCRAASRSASSAPTRARPRVLIANSLLVPRFANWDEFRRLEAEGLTMFGQMTAGSWIYIGTQGILQGTYQTFAAAGELHWGSPDLAGRTVLTAGLGGMGGAQPLAASLAGAASLNVEVDPHRIERRHRDALPGRGGRRPRRRRRAGRAPRRRRPRRLGRAARKRRRRLRRARPARACASTSSPTRRRPTTC